MRKALTLLIAMLTIACGERITGLRGPCGNEAICLTEPTPESYSLVAFGTETGEGVRISLLIDTERLPNLSDNERQTSLSIYRLEGDATIVAFSFSDISRDEQTNVQILLAHDTGSQGRFQVRVVSNYDPKMFRTFLVTVAPEL